MQAALLITGFILLVGFFLTWYVLLTVARLKKIKLRKSFLVLWTVGGTLAVGSVVMIILALVLIK